MGFKLTTKGIKSGLLIVFILSTIQLFSQPYLQDPRYGEDEEARKACANNLSIMSEYVKINMYDFAYDAWKICFKNCPAASKNIYIMGAKIIKHKIDNAQNEEVKNAYIDTLLLLYDKRIEFFNQVDYVCGIKGLDLLKYRPSELQAGYDLLKKSIELGKYNTSPAVFVTFVQVSGVMYKNNQKTADEFISDYLMVSDNANLSLQKQTKDEDIEDIKNAINSFETIFAESGAADCDAVVKIFTPKFEANPEDISLLKKITELMDRSNCKENDLYAKAAEKLYKLEPSARAAYNLGSLFEIKGENNKAKEYYSYAIQQETNPEDKAMYYYRKGAVSYNQGNYQDAKSDALNAIGLKNNYGDAYILIGTSYVAGSSTCSNDAFEKAATYWVAVDKFIKAKVVDSSVTEKANDLIGKYSIYFPNKEELFFRNLTDGMDYTVGCWINERTTVRSK